ncbi:hypothetical protein FO519_002372 [Halicephalobus sp. NKZ332]|nr:hypothetical protein FO519_002372 [Halicephalobus sp. NKZ332]
MPRPRRRRSASEDISAFIIDDDDDIEEDEPGPSHRRKSHKSEKTKTPKKKKPREDTEPEEEENEGDNLFERYREVEYVNRAMSVVLSLSHKGVFKENELKPFLNKKNKGDWKEGLRTVCDNMEHLFGYSLIYCGTSCCFTVRNNLIAETAALADLFGGKLNHERIDDGGASERQIIQQKMKEEEALLFPVLTMIMMSGGDRQENWSVTGDVLEEFLLHQLEVPENVVSKLLSGKLPVFVKQGWIQRTTKELEGTDPINHYAWGPRAVATVSASKLLEKYCLATGIAKTNFASFLKQLKKFDYKNGTLQGELHI